ncbi:MAG: hypothetical protein R3261_11845 [Alphaproteobacteria bacterium]|nr:hypothetical protein [Alphaproteobacteria bacterium]
MGFSRETLQDIDNYIYGDLRSEDWHLKYFDYLGDSQLAKRLGEEFFSTRHLYKFYQGIEASDSLMQAQVRIQILCYASIYEAVIHHILFSLMKDEARVQSLREYKTKKTISLPANKSKILQDSLNHDGKTIIPTYEDVAKTDDTKVRFDSKAECAYELGFIDQKLKEDLIEIFSARNAIHIHAEIRKGIAYELELSKMAYKRLLPLKDQTEKKIKELKIGSYTISE